LRGARHPHSTTHAQANDPRSAFAQTLAPMHMTPMSIAKQTGAPSPRASTLHVARDAVENFMSDRCLMMGASIGFYSAFSLAPTLLIVLAVLGWFFGSDIGTSQFFAQVKSIMGAEAAGAMQEIAQHAHRSQGGGAAAAVSVLLLAVGASATFASLNTALDVIFDAKPAHGLAGLALLIRTRLVSLALVMGLGFLLVVSLVLDAALQAAGKVVFGSVALGVFAALAQSAIALAVLAVGLTALIKWLPDTRVDLRHALVGGVVAALLFTIGRHLFGLYLAHAGTAGTFGAAGSLAVLMMLLYFCALVFLLGSEVTAVLYRRRRASRQPAPAIPRHRG
jgi:membrane protein